MTVVVKPAASGVAQLTEALKCDAGEESISLSILTVARVFTCVYKRVKGRTHACPTDGLAGELVQAATIRSAR
jgi:hypothetical protein